MGCQYLFQHFCVNFHLQTSGGDRGDRGFQDRGDNPSWKSRGEQEKAPPIRVRLGDKGNC